MIAVPRWLSVGTACLIAVYSVAVAVVAIGAGRSSTPAAVGLALFVVAFALGLAGGSGPQPGRWRGVVLTAVGLALPLLGSAGLDPVADGYASGAWYIGAVTCLVVQLLWRRRPLLAWTVVAGLVAHTVVWGGPQALVTFAVTAVVLITAVVTATGLALARTQQELERYSAARREALQWGAAQDAYDRERQGRLATTARLAAGQLQRIVETGGALTEADRFECRVLGQTIRDEIRGRHLLNDAVRDQVLTHRRRGAVVQVNDDGGLDDLTAAETTTLLQRVAEALEGLESDRIIIRTAPRDSATALTVVAMSSDPIAAALGTDDDEQVDLWLELARPLTAVR